MVYLDFPMGNGYSFVPFLLSYRFTDAELQADFYTFLEMFMFAFPQYKGRPLFIAGEGLGGHLIPVLSKHII